MTALEQARATWARRLTLAGALTCRARCGQPVMTWQQWRIATTPDGSRITGIRHLDCPTDEDEA